MYFMKNNIKKYVTAVALLMAMTASAQEIATERFAVKVSADRSLGKTLDTDCAFPGLQLDVMATSEYGIDFGWTIWQKQRHSLELNVGIGLGKVSIKAKTGEIDYSYSAPPEADMDGDSYIRYYELSGIEQKLKTDRINIPLYLDYRFQCSSVFSLHALMGFKFGFNYLSKATENNGTAFSYGIYPQYDDLLIDAPYMNMFGNTLLTSDQVTKPAINRINPAFLLGIGTEFRIWGPLAADLSLRYEGGMTDIYKDIRYDIVSFNAIDAPVTYTVADGQKVKALSEYITLSKMSRFSIALSLLCRF